jgi:hypothetical protein
MSKDTIISKLKAKVEIENTYENQIKLLNTEHRYTINKLEETYYNEVKKIKKDFNRPPRENATANDLYYLFGMVLHTGKNGTYVIREYATCRNKSDKWIKDIAKQYMKQRVKDVLKLYEDDPVILRIKDNKVYDEKEIVSKSLTGALTRLSKQMAVSNRLDNDRAENLDLKIKLALKEEHSKKVNKDWSLAQQFRDTGMTVREVAGIIGVSPSAVSKYTRKSGN